MVYETIHIRLDVRTANDARMLEILENLSDAMIILMTKQPEVMSASYQTEK